MSQKESKQCTESVEKAKESLQQDETDICNSNVELRRSSARIKRKQGNGVERVLEAMNGANKEEDTMNGKLWQYHKNTYSGFKRKIIKSYGETFYYNENAGPDWHGVESTRYCRYHIRKSMRFLQSNMDSDDD